MADNKTVACLLENKAFLSLQIDIYSEREDVSFVCFKTTQGIGTRFCPNLEIWVLNNLTRVRQTATYTFRSAGEILILKFSSKHMVIIPREMTLHWRTQVLNVRNVGIIGLWKFQNKLLNTDEEIREKRKFPAFWLLN